MSPLDAVAAAIRERLQAGQPAPLLGLGTLVRTHVSARVEERSDGSRVMLPPGETIALGPSSSSESSLALAFARFRAIPPDAAAGAYQDAIDQIEALLSATGEVRLPGVGLLRRTSGGVVLGVEAELLAAVNRRYEGLAPVPTTPSAPAVSTPPIPDATTEADTAPDAGATDTHEAEPRLQRSGLPLIETIPSSEDDADRAPIAAPLASPTPGEAEDVSATDAGIGDTDAEDDLADDQPRVEHVKVDAAETMPEADAPQADGNGVGTTEEAEDAIAIEDHTSAERAGDAPEGGPPADASTPPYGRPLIGAPDPSADATADALSDEVAEEAQEQERAQAEVPLSDPAGDSERSIGEVEAPADEVERPAIETMTATNSADLYEPDTEAHSNRSDAEADALVQAPFGGPDAPPLSEVLPPTEPEPTPEDTPPLSPDDEWERETWTAPPLDDAPSFDPGLTADTDLVDAVIEDADFDIVPPTAATPIAFADVPDAVPEAPPILSVLPPTTNLDAAAAVDDPTLVLDAPPQASRPASGTSESAKASDRRWLMWMVLAFVLVALAVAVIWFWPEIRSRARLMASPEETITVDANAGRPDVADDSIVRNTSPGGVPADDALMNGADLLDPTGASLPTGPARAPDPRAARPPLAARSQATDDDPPAPPTGLGESPAPGVALLPPRVSGLDPSSIDALAARDQPVDPTADAWTFVVLSTASRTEAEALRARYRRAGYRASVLTSRSGQFRVCIGQFATRDDAVRLRDRLPPQAPADTWALYLQTL